MPAHLLNPRRDADAAGLGQRFEAGGDIDAVTEDVAVLDDDIANVHADAELDRLIGGTPALRSVIAALHLDGAVQRIDHAGELDQHAVAGGLDDAAAVLGDLRVDELAAQRLQPGERAVLVRAISRE